MHIARTPHRWRLTPSEAVALQRELAGRVLLEPLGRVRYVVGLDCAFTPVNVLAVAVVWDLEKGRVLERRGASAPLTFPYVPGLLSFREVPALLKVLRAVRSPVDVLLCDGQGLAHPRRFGVACHLGVLLAMPAVGCAKSRLTGRAVEPGAARGARSDLIDECSGEVLGQVLRTRAGVKPVYVSPGHLCEMPDALELVLRCTAGYRLPEPTRLADREVAAYKRAGRYRGGVAAGAAAPASSLAK